MDGLHFLHPAWLGLLVLVPLLWAWFWWRRPKPRQWRDIVDAELAPFVLSGSAQQRPWLPLAVLSVLAVVTIVALAGPAWDKKEVPVFRQQQAVVLALDLSQSMHARDMNPERLERARYKLIDLLQAREEGQTGLVVFAGDAFTVSPLTDDARTIEAQMKGLTPDIMPAQGSAADRAVSKASELLEQAGLQQGSIVLLTDGVGDNAAAKQAIEAARTKGYSVSILGFGTPSGAPVPLRNGGFLLDAQGKTVMPRLDVANLRDLAQAGDGVYATASINSQDVAQLQAHWASLAQRSDVRQDQAGRQVDAWANAGIWLVLLLLPVAMFLFRRGWLTLIAVAILLQRPAEVQAAVWEDLWQTPDQQGQQALDAGDAQRALQLFKNDDWRAAAAYRAGDYELAAQLYANSDTLDGLYNYGNVLARQGKIPQAIAVYERVLTRDPQNEDARHNLEVLQQQQEQQQEEGQQQQQQNQSQQQQERNQSENQANHESADNQQSEREQSSQTESPPEERPEPEDQSEQAESEQDQEPQQADPEQQRATQQEKEQQQATEQWLRRIPDDPAGLWRRKFLYQYRQRGAQTAEEQPW